MDLKNWKSIYLKSPNLLKKAYSIMPWELRMGSAYRRIFKFLKESSAWSEDQWHVYQTRELFELLHYCNLYVPFYQECFKQYSINLDSSDIWEEFRKIPFVDKDILRKHNAQFVSRQYGKGVLYKGTTGGTTGKPVSITFDKLSYKKEWAFKMFFWQTVLGYSLAEKKATFRGVDQGGGLFVENPIYNEIRFSPFHLEKEADLFAIRKKLLSYRPTFYHGYPSALYQLAKFLKEKKLTLPIVKGVILISENSFEYQIELLSEVFQCPVYSFYGLTERVVMASMDKTFENYYAHPAYGILEIITKNDKIISEVECYGEIVGTGFTNSGMPLLRYKTGDFSCYTNSTNKEWHMPAISKVKGRWNQEFIVGKNGENISLTALNMHSNIYDNVKKFQLFQSVPGILVLNIVKGNEYRECDADTIRQAYYRKLRESFDIKIVYLEELPLTKAGKSKYFVRKLDIP